ncbi:MAG: HupE/UreJ family protein [Thiohalomonadales bacterium]
MRYHWHVIFGLLVLLLAQPVCAHDPGFSNVVIQKDGHQLTITMTFSLTDMALLVRMDENLDGIIDQNEFAAKRLHLKTRLQSSVEFIYDGPTKSSIQSPLGDISLMWTGSNAVEISLQYPQQVERDAVISFPIIQQLSRGHRMFAIVREVDTSQVSQYILSADAISLSIKPSSVGASASFGHFIVEGIHHIWAGLDHLLFLIILLLPAVMRYRNQQWQAHTDLRSIVLNTIKIVTAFTLAHSITLFLAVFEVVRLPVLWVESVIALSVMLAALNNLRPQVTSSRWLLAFVFGLVHGFGFANAIVGLDLQSKQLALSLLGFNLGVEFGQLIVVLLLLPMIIAVRHRPSYRTWGLGAGSVVVLIISTVWAFERIFNIEILSI